MQHFYEVTARNAAGDALFLGEESTDAYDFVRVPDTVADGGGLPVLLAFLMGKRSALRYDSGRGHMVRNRVASFRVRLPHARGHAWEFRREADGSLTQLTAKDGPVRVADRDRPEISVTGPERASTPDRPGTPLVVVRKGHGADVKAPTGAERVNDTTTERLTVSADNPKGEPVYVKRLPERHAVHRGKSVMDVFSHEGYWFTVPGDFPASLPEDCHQTRQTFAVFQSPDVVPGALVWVVRAADGRSVRNLGTSTESRRVAVREALSALAYQREQRAEEITAARRAAGYEERPPVRLAVSDDGRAWAVHVRCECEIPDSLLMAEVESVSDAADPFADGQDPWTLCDAAPVALRDDDGTPYAWIRASGERGPDGAPLLSVAPMGGGPGYTVRLESIGARHI